MRVTASQIEENQIGRCVVEKTRQAAGQPEIRGLDFAEKEKELILGGNAARLLGLES